ncbi:G-box-binding factor 4 [Linum perenne]
MASSKVMSSSKPRVSDLSASSSSSSQATRSRHYRAPSSDHHSTIRPPHNTGNGFSSTAMTVDGVLPGVYSAPPSTASALPADHVTLINSNDDEIANGFKTPDDIWKEIVTTGRKELKEEESDEMMTLEDFLAKAGAEEGCEEEGEEDEDHEVKMPMLSYDPVAPPANAIHMVDKVEGSMVRFGSGSGGRGKRGRAPAMEQLDKAAQQRQKRMIKNRESAARSRERKQAYQLELESLAVKLEEEHEQLLKEMEEGTKERLKQVCKLSSITSRSSIS